MNPRRRTITLILWATLVVAMVGAVVGQFLVPKPASDLKELFPAATFSLTDQEGHTFASAQLHGSPWIADFIFTSCAGTCPLMSHKMAELQQELPARVKLVSFSVDPQHDTPSILSQYAAALKADGSRWHFLTGTMDQMFQAAADMKISAKPAEKNEGILHSNKFVLVNSRGNIVGYYDSTSGEQMKKLVSDAKELARQSGDAAS